MATARPPSTTTLDRLDQLDRLARADALALDGYVGAQAQVLSKPQARRLTGLSALRASSCAAHKTVEPGPVTTTLPLLQARVSAAGRKRGALMTVGHAAHSVGCASGRLALPPGSSPARVLPPLLEPSAAVPVFSAAPPNCGVPCATTRAVLAPPALHPGQVCRPDRHRHVFTLARWRGWPSKPPASRLQQRAVALHADGAVFCIGRAMAGQQPTDELSPVRCLITLPSHLRLIGLRHARLECVGDRLMRVCVGAVPASAGSRVWVNGDLLAPSSAAVLRDGDELVIGSMDARYGVRYDYSRDPDIVGGAPVLGGWAPAGQSHSTKSASRHHLASAWRPRLVFCDDSRVLRRLYGRQLKSLNADLLSSCVMGATEQEAQACVDIVMGRGGAGHSTRVADVVILDQNLEYGDMIRLKGTDIAQRLDAEPKFHGHVILRSGNTDEALEEYRGCPGVHLVLAKTSPMRELAKAVREHCSAFLASRCPPRISASASDANADADADGTEPTAHVGALLTRPASAPQGAPKSCESRCRAVRVVHEIRATPGWKHWQNDSAMAG